MKAYSRAMVLTGPQKLELQRFGLPETGEDDGLLALECVGVCGSDPGIFEGRPTRGPRPYPIILGHEIVGRIYKMGKAAQIRHGVAEGDRVVLEYAFGCGQCGPCLSGGYTLCDRNYTYGSMITCQDPPHLYGGYSDFVYIHPRAMVHKIGEDISAEVGVLICAVIGNGIRWLRQIGGVSIGDTVVIVGPGLQGIAATAVAKEAGAGCIIVAGLARDRARLETARRFGADRVIDIEETDPVKVVTEMTAGRMADVAMDVSGSPAGADLALSLAGKRATVVLPGIYKDSRVPINLNRAVVNEIRMLGVFSHDFRAVRPAIRMVRQNKYPFDDLISHRFKLEDAEQALRLVGGKIQGEPPLKVLLYPETA
ncbi:MAG: alcohol dehydrogenase catalytic domain-containing protein [Desulfobacterales bacterium]|nr:alcohol dehydrogenase catalytic domain-containing protein [Desulfobacterales bacterium]